MSNEEKETGGGGGKGVKEGRNRPLDENFFLSFGDGQSFVCSDHFDSSSTTGGYWLISRTR